ncbi:isoprenylcysteine carboxylmethyltransferase family protein [Chitinimonas sp.]|uniref:methyltransferase family protein n=1 Tax=Chitinimonas sp. TaxID=1934313 RepID=UPI002F93BB71
MLDLDQTLNLLHIALWIAFAATRRHVALSAPAPSEPGNTIQRTAPWSRHLVGVHTLAFAAMYGGMHYALFRHAVPDWFPGQRLVGGTLIVLAGMLACWSLLHFRSWRFRAQLDAGHQLATGGPFRLFRHPIYMALNLVALGTAIWVPTPACWLGFALMVIGSDLRARSEETLLHAAFGQVYAAYCERTQRFLPGLY